MARIPRPVPIHDFRRLSLREVVDLWLREIDIHPLALERELRRFALNTGLNWRAGERIDPDKPDADLPAIDILVDKQWLAYFCEKKRWPLPTFWFPPDPEEVKRQGRPSHMDAIVQELERRAEADELEDTVTHQARVLNEWAVEQGHDRMKVMSIRNRISRRFRELKERH